MTTDYDGLPERGLDVLRLGHILRAAEGMAAAITAAESFRLEQLETLEFERIGEEVRRTQLRLQDMARHVEEPVLRLLAARIAIEEPLRRIGAHQRAVQRTLERVNLDNVIRSAARMSELSSRIGKSVSAVQAALAVAQTLRPPDVELVRWKLALKEAERHLKQAQEDEAPPPPLDASDSAEENLVEQVIFLVWVILGYLARLSFALQLVTGGDHSLIPRWTSGDPSPPGLQDMVQILEAGPIHTVTCRAVMREGPSVAEDPVYRLDKGDTVQVYGGGGAWVKAVCTETWYAGWVYTRHLRNP